MDSYFLLQEIFLTQRLNPGLQHYRQILYHPSYREVVSIDTIIKLHKTKLPASPNFLLFITPWLLHKLSSVYDVLYPLACISKGHLSSRIRLFTSFTQFSSVQSLTRVRLFVTPSTAACQASLSITNSQSPPKPTSIESVMTSNHLILCHPLLLLPSIFPASGSFQMSQLFASSGQSIWVSCPQSLLFLLIRLNTLHCEYVLFTPHNPLWGQQ